MKAMDEKGRLFGLVNILDLFLILILLGALAFAGLKFSQKGDLTIGQATGQQEVMYTLYNSGEHLFVVSEIKAGDVIKSVDTNAVLGTITEVETKQANNYVNTADGRTVLSAVPEKVEVYLKIKANATLAGESASIGGTGLLIGNRVKVKGPVYMMEMLIREVQTGDTE